MGIQPDFTRLRFVTAKDPQDLSKFLMLLGKRVEIKGAPVWDGKKWILWFIPDDQKDDVQSVNL